jgi:uncharacterized protein YutE (UPF0331/DUF86 family)
VVRGLEPLLGFRNVVVHGYIALDMARVVDALDRLGPVEHFLVIVRDLERGGGGLGQGSATGCS